MPPCAWQKGQCSKALIGSPCSDDCDAVSSLTNLSPADEQISAQSERGLPPSESAWEIDGASAAIRITMQAIAAVIRLNSRV